MTEDLYLGKELKKPETKLTPGLNNCKVDYKELGKMVLILGDSPDQNGHLSKVLMEELSKKDEVIISFDSEGILSSYGLIFPKLEPEDFSKWILLDSEEDYIDLQAIEESSRFNQLLQTFKINKSELEDYVNNLFFVIFTPNSDNGVNISSTAFDINFNKIKNFAKPIIYTLGAWLFTDDSITKYDEEINFLKLIYEFIRKYKLEVTDYPKSKSFLLEVQENIDKFPGSPDTKNKMIEILLKFIKDNASIFFEGIPLNFNTILEPNPRKKNVIIFSLKHMEDIFFKNFFLMKSLHQLSQYAIDNKDKKITVLINSIDDILFFKEFISSIKSVLEKDLDNLRFVLSTSIYKNLLHLDLKDFNNIFIGKTTNDNVQNTMSKKFGFPASLLTEIKKENFVLIKNQKLTSLLHPRITYSYHRVLEPFEIARVLEEKDRDNYEKYYYRLDDIKDKYPELQKKKIGILTIENGPYRGKDIIIDKDEIVIGRYEVYPQNKLISRKHFKIHREGGHFVITDNSVNGVFINGRRITQATLKERDTIVLGRNEASLYFEEKEI